MDSNACMKFEMDDFLVSTLKRIPQPSYPPLLLLSMCHLVNTRWSNYMHTCLLINEKCKCKHSNA